MSKKLTWDQSGERYYETGVNHGVLYPQESDGTYPKGYAWNGLSAINESPDGAESNPIYADNIKYLDLISAEEYGITIESYTYPDEFAECDGSAELGTGVSIGQQRRKAFGLSYRTIIGNDVDGEDYGYKLHLVYGCKASPSERNHETVNDSPDALSLSWDVSTTPVDVPGHKPTATVEIDSTKVDAAVLAKIEAALYGTDEKDAYLPLPAELITMIGTK